MDLDDAYANSENIEGAAGYFERWAREAAMFRNSLGARAERNVPYGEHPRQVMDLFHPTRLARGLAVFVHGGYWRSSDKDSWSHLGAAAVAAGWSVAMPSYPLCPEVRIRDITVSVSRALAAAKARVPGPVVVAGHSAGGHLAMRMASTDPDVTRALAISPLADLRPMLDLKMNAESWHMDAEEAQAESPACHPVPEVPVVVWFGGDEQPGFFDQAEAARQAWGCKVVAVPGRHHFDVIDALSVPGSDMLRAWLGG